jgi:hypothetical protein
VTRLLLRGLAVLLGVAVVLPAAYVLVALVLALVPVNGDFRPAPDGIAVYVRTNGVHAELVLPTRADNTDWSKDHPASDMRALGAPMPWIAFGWATPSSSPTRRRGPT